MNRSMPTHRHRATGTIERPAPPSAATVRALPREGRVARRFAAAALAALALIFAAHPVQAQNTTRDQPETARPIEGEVPESARDALIDLRDLLSLEGSEISANELDAALGNLRILVAATANETLQIVRVAVPAAEGALLADPLERRALVAALQELALSMRVAAGPDTPDEASLLVEVASLVEQTAELIEAGDLTPRLEVETP